ncbi:MAG: hypothetical protein ACOYMD_04690 [Paludibacter sp.]
MKLNISLNKILYLLKQYFTENLNGQIIYWSIMTLLFAAFDQRGFVLMVLYISGFVFTIQLNSKLNKQTVGMQYFLLPASQTDKIVVSIILNTIYYFVMTILAYVVGNLLILLIYHGILKIDVPINWDLFQFSIPSLNDGIMQLTERNEFWSILGTFATIQSISLLGSLYFKRNPMGKTILSVITIGLMFLIIQFLLMDIFIGNIEFFEKIKWLTIIYNEINVSTSTGILIMKMCVSLIIPFLWLVSYFKLTEKQI